MDRGRIRGQIASQFMVLVGFLFIVFVIFVAGIAGKYKEISNEREEISVKDLALKLRGEINLAHSTYDGYERNLTVPYNLNGLNFTVNLPTSNVLQVISENEEYTVIIPSINGSCTYGVNTIRKNNGRVCISMEVC